MENNDMRKLLGLMRNFQKNQLNENVETLTDEEIKNIEELILKRIEDFSKFYYVDILSIRKEQDGLYINGKYSYDENEYMINLIYKKNPNNTDITIEQPDNIITTGTEEDTVADMVNAFHDIFINLQYDDQFKEYI
jgi:hypothetical protein